MNPAGRDVPPQALRLNAVLRKAGSAEVRAYAKYSADTTGMVLLKWVGNATKGHTETAHGVDAV